MNGEWDFSKLISNNWDKGNANDQNFIVIAGTWQTTIWITKKNMIALRTRDNTLRHQHGTVSKYFNKKICCAILEQKILLCHSPSI